jgi:CheY-like chemotaxis protein
MSACESGTGLNGHMVECHRCNAEFDATAASWCSCLVKDRSVECPECGGCLCSATAALRDAFWLAAPADLHTRRRALRAEARSFRNPDAEGIRHPLVLVVEDDEHVRALAAHAVKSMRYGVIVASNGIDGLELARTHRPELVLTDALMPQMDGREMCRRIKEDEFLANTPVVVMTSLYTKAQQKYEALREFRADRYVPKPVSFDELRDLLQSYLGIGETEWEAEYERRQREREKERGGLLFAFSIEPQVP